MVKGFRWRGAHRSLLIVARVQVDCLWIASQCRVPCPFPGIKVRQRDEMGVPHRSGDWKLALVWCRQEGMLTSNTIRGLPKLQTVVCSMATHVALRSDMCWAQEWLLYYAVFQSASAYPTSVLVSRMCDLGCISQPVPD